MKRNHNQSIDITHVVFTWSFDQPLQSNCVFMVADENSHGTKQLLMICSVQIVLVLLLPLSSASQLLERVLSIDFEKNIKN